MARNHSALESRPRPQGHKLVARNPAKVYIRGSPAILPTLCFHAHSQAAYSTSALARLRKSRLHAALQQPSRPATRQRPLQADASGHLLGDCKSISLL